MSVGTYMKKNIVGKYKGQKGHVNMQCEKAEGEVCFSVGTKF